MFAPVFEKGVFEYQPLKYSKEKDYLFSISENEV